MPLLTSLEFKNKKSKPKKITYKRNIKTPPPRFLYLYQARNLLEKRLARNSFRFSEDSLLQLWEICFFVQLHPPEIEDKEYLLGGIELVEEKLKQGAEWIRVPAKWVELLLEALPLADKIYTDKIKKK